MSAPAAAAASKDEQQPVHRFKLGDPFIMSANGVAVCGVVLFHMRVEDNDDVYMVNYKGNGYRVSNEQIKSRCMMKPTDPAFTAAMRKRAAKVAEEED